MRNWFQAFAFKWVNLCRYLAVMKRWESAPHCEIGRSDPEGYKKALKEFLTPAAELTEAVNNIKPWDKD